MHTSRIRWVSLVFAALGTAAPLAHAGDVNIGVSITGEIVPGVYGRVDLTNRPAPPPVVYAQPVIVEQVPGAGAHRRSTCTCRRATRRTGASIATSTMRATSRVFFVKSAEYEPVIARIGITAIRHDDHYDRHDDRDHHGDDRGDHDHDHHDRDHGDHDHGDHHDHD